MLTSLLCWFCMQLLRVDRLSMKVIVLAFLLSRAAASPPNYGGSTFNSIISSLSQLVPSLSSGNYAPITKQIINDYAEPVKVSQSTGMYFCR